MKKNITINLCGRLHNIDEDAYELLSHYTEALRSYFKRQEGGEEIAADIEERIAEHLDELKAAGIQAITIEHLRDIIARVGELEDLAPGYDAHSSEGSPASGADSASQSQAQSGSNGGGSGKSVFNDWIDSMKGKRFYRSSQDKILAGVLGGCAQFFGGSSLAWRLGFVLLILAPSCFLLNDLCWLSIILYILVAILAPVAATPEDRLRQRGIAVTPQTLSDEVRTTGTTPPPASGCVAQFFSIMGKMLLFFFAITGMLMFIPFIIFICMLAAFAVHPMWMAHNILGHYAEELMGNLYGDLWMLGIAAIVAVFVPAYCALHWFLSTAKKVEPMSIVQRVIWLLIWLLAVIGIVISCVKISKVQDDHRLNITIKARLEQDEWDRAHTHEGVVMNDEDWEFFNAGGWRLLRNEHCVNNRYTYSGQYYTGDESVRYLDAATSWEGSLIYQAERTDTLEAGIYKLTAMARCAEGGCGVFIYAQTSGTQGAHLHMSDVPAYGNETKPGSLAYGWSVVTIDSITLPTQQVLQYGVSTDKAFTGKKCSTKWFSATDFKVERIGNYTGD